MRSVFGRVKLIEKFRLGYEASEEGVAVPWEKASRWSSSVRAPSKEFHGRTPPARGSRSWREFRGSRLSKWTEVL